MEQNWWTMLLKTGIVLKWLDYNHFDNSIFKADFSVHHMWKSPERGNSEVILKSLHTSLSLIVNMHRRIIRREDLWQNNFETEKKIEIKTKVWPLQRRHKNSWNKNWKLKKSPSLTITHAQADMSRYDYKEWDRISRLFLYLSIHRTYRYQQINNQSQSRYALQ